MPPPRRSVNAPCPRPDEKICKTEVESLTVRSIPWLAGDGLGSPSPASQDRDHLLRQCACSRRDCRGSRIVHTGPDEGC